MTVASDGKTPDSALGSTKQPPPGAPPAYLHIRGWPLVPGPQKPQHAGTFWGANLAVEDASAVFAEVNDLPLLELEAVRFLAGQL
jgi:hypothetical protein